MIEAFSGRGLGTVSDMVLSINDNTVELPVLPEIYNRQFNLRFFIEFPEEQVSFNETVLGTKIEHFDLEYFAVNGGKLDISSATNAINFEVDTSKITNGEYFLSCTVYHDKPIHHYPVLATLPIPTEILTYHFVFTKTQNVKLASFPVQKYFDGYSHLGFFLADLPKMKQIIEDKYGSKSLDLVDEFSNTTLIDDLFSAGVILIVWGVNPYTYPIFSAHKEDVSRLEIILGQAFTQKGIYRIDEGITKMSVVPGHEILTQRYGW